MDKKLLSRLRPRVAEEATGYRRKSVSGSSIHMLLERDAQGRPVHDEADAGAFRLTPRARQALGLKAYV